MIDVGNEGQGLAGDHGAAGERGGVEGHGSTEDTAQHPPVEVSPDEKLSGPGSSSPRVPGTQNTDSEIKGERSPNTE
jgi:hypothetical protein